MINKLRFNLTEVMKMTLGGRKYFRFCSKTTMVIAPKLHTAG